MHVKCASFAAACGYMHFFLIVWFIVINDYFYIKKKLQYCVYFIELFACCRLMTIAVSLRQ